jgi:hypothetical protein
MNLSTDLISALEVESADSSETLVSVKLHGITKHKSVKMPRNVLTYRRYDLIGT